MKDDEKVTGEGADTRDANSCRVVFVSYKHEDLAVAKLIADKFREIVERAHKKIQVFLSNHPDFRGAKFGGTLQDEIAEALLITEVFFFVYTGKNKDYSWCMYEAGLATNPKSIRGTRVIVFSLVDEVPDVFHGKVVVKAKDSRALEKLFHDFCFQDTFFPGDRGPLLEDHGIMRDAASDKSKELFSALQDYFDLGERREVPRWPTIHLQLAMPDVTRFVELVRQDPSAFAAEKSKRSAAVQHFLENAIVTHSEKEGAEAFGFNWGNTPEPLARIRENWLEQRQTVSSKTIADNTPWDLILAKEVYNICRSSTVEPDWSPFLDLKNENKWLYPLISASFINRDGSRDFRVRIVPSLSPGEAIPGE